MKNYNQIARYLKGEMKEAEKVAFEIAMAKDSALAEEVQFQTFEEEAIDQMVEDDILAQVREIRAEPPQAAPKKKTSILNIRWIQIAVAASVILVAGFFIGRQLNQGMPNSELAASYYQKYSPDFSTTRQIDGGNTAENKKYRDYLNQRDLSKMDEVIAYFSQLEDPESTYLTGHACYIKKDFKNAVQYFKKYLDSTTKKDRDYERAQFYLALAYLAEGDIEAALYQLNSIRTLQNHSFKSQADSLFSELENN